MRPEAHLFGLSATSWPRSLQFSVAGIGIFLAFFFPGVAHVQLHEDFNFNEPITFAFLQFLAVAITCMPSYFRICFSRRPLTVHLCVHLLVSAALIASIVLDNYAAFRLSHSTELLFKSPKLIPVMLGNIVFLKRRLSISEILIVCVIVTGLVGFTLGDFVGRADLDFWGVAALFVSLSLEAVAANLEERLLVDLKAPQSEVMALIFGPGAIGTFLLASVTGEMKSVISKVQIGRCLWYLAGYAFLGAIGLHFVIFSMTLFGSLQTVLFTSVRKVHNATCMILLSDDQQFTNCHRISICVLVIGLIANTVERLGAGIEWKHEKGPEDPFTFLEEPANEQFSEEPMVTDSSSTVSM
jgi:adenosine 3'-phospho 5'-phosphosulfate transporter B3